MILNGFAVIGLAFSGCDVIMAIVLMTLSLMLHGAVSTGALSSVVDIGPNYAGITLGIVSSLGTMTGFVSPIIVGYLTFENQSIVAWRWIFLICAAMLLGCGVLYIACNDTSIQPWNKSSDENKDDKELQPLKGEKQIPLKDGRGFTGNVVDGVINVEKPEK